MCKFKSKRYILSFILLTTVLIFILNNFYTFQIRVDKIIKPITRPPKFSKRNFESWPFSIPVDQKRIINSTIISELYTKSGKIHSNLILPIFITEDYLALLFNWISNVLLQDSPHLLRFMLVMPLDDVSCEIIQHFNVAYICINPPKLLLHLNTFQSVKTRLQTIFTVRMICFWLFSSWGFDILHFDVDAIPVRPKFSDLFLRGDEADIVSGIGFFPHSVYMNLGATVCMGSFYLKSLISSEGVRQLFITMSTIDSYDDQLKMNNALVRMGLYWKSKEPGQTWIGLDSNQRLRVNFLPETIVCRVTCVKLFEIRGTAKDELYLMHPFTKKSGQEKESMFRALNLWQLKTYVISNIYIFNLDLIDYVKSIS